VQIREAHLTHQIERNSHVEISTPFFKKDTTHANKSFADFTPVEEDGKLMMTYSLEAQDIVKVKSKLASQLTVGGFWKDAENNRVNVHSESSLSYSYSFRQAVRDMGRADLEYQIRPYVDSFFKNTFSTIQPDGKVSGSFPAWLSDLDNTVESSLQNGPDKFGDTLLSLELSVPAVVTSAWLDAPAEEKADIYMSMSHRLQEVLKYFVPYFYFQNPGKFKDIPAVAGILAYAALPPMTRITGIFPDIKFDTRTGVYWDHQHQPYYNAMLDRVDTGQRLGAVLGRIQSRLNETPEHKDLADDYAPQRAGVFLSLARNQQIGENNLRALLRYESEVVNGAMKAGVAFAKFRDKSKDKPGEAIENLAEFGAKLTQTFNSSLSGLHGGDKSRVMSTLLFVEAARALRPSLSTTPGTAPTALLELIVLKKDSSFKAKIAEYISGEIPEPDETLVEQRLVSLK
jgi:hypothetical protein